jgi:Fe2+ or Zn2+ uptake regulation protein
MSRIEQICIEKGLRMTQPRRVIAQVLSESDDHPDAEELHRRANAIDKSISLATVYRTVKLFEDYDIIERHDFRDGRARACLTGYVLTALEKPQHYLAAFSSVLEGQHAISDSSNKARAFEFLIEMVREGQSLGLVVEALDRVAVAKMLWCCIHGAASLMAHMPTFPEGEPCPISLDRNDFLQQHAEFILNGLMRS